MRNEAPAQRYYRARQQASWDAKRKRHPVPTFDLLSITLPELRGLMGMSQEKLASILTEQGFPISRAMLAHIETGNREITDYLRGAITRLIQQRRTPCQNDTVSPPSISA